MRKRFLVLFIIACIFTVLTFIWGYWALIDDLLQVEWQNGMPVFGLEIIVMIIFFLPISYIGGAISITLLAICLHGLNKPLKIIALILLILHAILILVVTFFYVINGYIDSSKEEQTSTAASILIPLIKGSL